MSGWKRFALVAGGAAMLACIVLWVDPFVGLMAAGVAHVAAEWLRDRA